MTRPSEPTSRPLDLTASIRGRNALVTGGSRGIGRACVEALLAHGARVALTYNRGQLEAEELVQRWPDHASCHRLDLQDPASITRCFEEFQQRWGPLHILVNNAAVGSATVSDYETDTRRWDDAFFEINAHGALRVAQEGLALMRRHPSEEHGKLINVSSVGGIQIFPSMRLSDNMSKTAVVAMSQQLAAELAQAPIDVFTVCPGATDTGMFRRSTLDKMDEERRQHFVNRLPKRRLIHPEEVARVILFLCSSWSTVLHGAVLDCSMGLGVHPGLMTGGAS
jgi:NAD(P)-dependent dehydrogenase (short-subunit alcohol dehydrogenase family)